MPHPMAPMVMRFDGAVRAARAQGARATSAAAPAAWMKRRRLIDWEFGVDEGEVTIASSALDPVRRIQQIVAKRLPGHQEQGRREV